MSFTAAYSELQALDVEAGDRLTRAPRILDRDAWRDEDWSAVPNVDAATVDDIAIIDTDEDYSDYPKREWKALKGFKTWKPSGMTHADEKIRDAIDDAAVTAAREVLRGAPAQGPTLALVSGGHDSLTAMHVAYQSRHIALDGIVHINTGIGIPETRAFVRQRADALGLDYYEVGRPGPDHQPGHEYRREWETYEHLVREYGFPGPPVHDMMYANLKEKPLQRFLSEWERTPTLVSGVRRHESETRMETVDSDGQQTWLGCPTVSPIVEFRGIDVRRYRRALDLPMNPVVDKLEMSGECLCGAMADRDERRMLRLFYPQVDRYLRCLEGAVYNRTLLEDGPPREYAEWGHGRLRDRELDATTDDDQLLLCATCERRRQCGGGGCDDD